MPGPDPDDLHHNLDNLRHHLASVGRDLTDLSEHQRRATRSRLSLLHIHAVTGIAVGSGVIANGPEGIGSPAYAIIRMVPGAPFTVGAILVILGLVLAVATWRRDVAVEMVAAGGIVIWYLMFATSFVGAMISWQLDPQGQKPSWQGMFSYYGWAALLIAHLRILAWVRATRGRVSR